MTEEKRTILNVIKFLGQAKRNDIEALGLSCRELVELKLDHKIHNARPGIYVLGSKPKREE